MEEYTNSFTKWCTDNIMKADSATGTLPSGPVLVERIDCAIGFLLNDAAQQNRGEVFDPERLTAARLDKMNKSQLISLVLNFAWFSHKTMSPCFGELQDQITEQTKSASQRDEHVVEVQANLIHSMKKVERLQDLLLLEKEPRLRHWCLLWGTQ